MDYTLLIETVKNYCGNEPGLIPLLSNVSSVLYDEMENLNWAGFYLLRNKEDKAYVSVDLKDEACNVGDYELVVGPFQGKPACIKIPIGKGVCGTSAKEMAVQRVANVHEFPGHIACDCASNSEIVLPLIKEGRLFGVLDIDSPLLSRFDEADEAGLKEVAKSIGDAVEF